MAVHLQNDPQWTIIISLGKSTNKVSSSASKNSIYSLDNTIFFLKFRQIRKIKDISGKYIFFIEKFYPCHLQRGKKSIL